MKDNVGRTTSIVLAAAAALFVVFSLSSVAAPTRSVLTFGSYEMYKSALLDRFKNVKPIFMVALAACLGDFTGSVWVFPTDVVKQKVQGGIYAQTGEAIRSIWASRGLLGFYEGYLSALARDIPFRVAQLTTYEYTKDVYLGIKKKRAAAGATVELSPAEAALVGAVAGTVAAFVTCPLDRFKTLLVIDSEKWGGSVFSCAAKVWQQEGPRGLLTGVVPRLSYITPSVAIFFVAYEFAQQKLKKWEGQ
jgi:solute carrier family 25 (mitochondrial S-adenosylmethionine transporter), member 26